MGYILTNGLQIAGATVAGLLVGLVYMAVVPRRGQGSGWGLAVLAVVAEFWLACILAGALILAPPGPNRWVMALGSAVVIWIGFVLPTVAVSYGFRGQRVFVTVGDVLHWLVVMVVQAAVLQAIGLTHP